MDTKKYGLPRSEQDSEYTWQKLQGVVTFYLKAAEAGRFVLFTADQ